MPVSSPWPGHRSGEDAAEATKPIRNRRSGCVYGWDVGVIDLTARYGINDFETLTLQTSPTVRSEARYQEDGSSGEFGAVFTRPLGSRLTSEPHFIHDFSDDNGVSNSRTTLSGVGSPEQGFASDSKASETILRTLVRFEQSANLTWESGGEIAYNMLEADQAFSNGGVLVPLASASVKVEETRGEVFGLGAWRLRDNLTVESGVRVEGSTINQSGDADSEKAFSIIKPRLLATWTSWTNTHPRALRTRGGPVGLQRLRRLGRTAERERPRRQYRRRDAGSAVSKHPGAVGPVRLCGRPDQRAQHLEPHRGHRSHDRQDAPALQRPEIPRRHRHRTGHRVARSSMERRLGPLLGRTSYDPDVQFSWRGRDFLEGWVEYKPTSTLALRAQINVWDDYHQTRIAYADRTKRPISYVETRNIDPRTFYSLRLRKTF